jgi:hypothetical protein
MIGQWCVEHTSVDVITCNVCVSGQLGWARAKIQRGFLSRLLPLAWKSEAVSIQSWGIGRRVWAVEELRVKEGALARGRDYGKWETCAAAGWYLRGGALVARVCFPGRI